MDFRHMTKEEREIYNKAIDELFTPVYNEDGERVNLFTSKKKDISKVNAFINSKDNQ